MLVLILALIGFVLIFCFVLLWGLSEIRYDPMLATRQPPGVAPAR